MSVSFKDYVIISDAFREVQLEEGKLEDLWNAVKKKLGGKASDEEVQAELERLQKIDKKSIDAIGNTQQSRDFHARKAAEKAKALGAKKPEPTRGTQPNTAASFKAKSTSDMKGGELRALDRNPFGEGLVSEGLKEYRVEYTAKTGGPSKFGKIKAQDVTAVREKFKRDFHGMKIVTVTPATVRVPKKPVKVEETFGPLGPRKSIGESMKLDELFEAAEAKVVVMKVTFDYVTRSDREKSGNVTLFWTCKTAEEAQELKKKIEAAGDSDDGLYSDSNYDMIAHWGQNSYSDFQENHGDMLYVDDVKIVAKEPALGRKVYGFNPKDFGF